MRQPQGGGRCLSGYRRKERDANLGHPASVRPSQNRIVEYLAMYEQLSADFYFFILAAASRSTSSVG